MNILFFLKPKAEVAFVYDYHTLRQAMEIMEYHKYSSIPMIHRDLMEKAMDQNFVPVIDDQQNFIGIITRKDIIGYCYEKIKKIAN